MAFVTNLKGEELIFHFDEELHRFVFITLPDGTIEKMIGRKLTRKEGPVNLSFPNRQWRGSFIETKITGTDMMEAIDVPVIINN